MHPLTSPPKTRPRYAGIFSPRKGGRSVDGAKGSPRRTGGFPWNRLNASRRERQSTPWRHARDVDKGFDVIETERGAITPRPGLILERPREGRCEERTLLAAILPDRRFDVAASQCVCGLFFVGSDLGSSFVEMKSALSQEEESQRTVQGGNLRQGLLPACRRGISGGSDSVAGASGVPRRPPLDVPSPSAAT